jgi:plasmid stabilization system protein ParE
MFLGYMKVRETSFNAIVVDIHKETLDARARMQSSLEACTRALAENSMVSLRQTAMIEKMLDRIERNERP